MSFWKTFGFHTVSAIDTILDGGEYTLEQLLDEDEILQETKSQNKKLLDFLVEEQTMRQLLVYITVEPSDSEDEDPKRKYKYPFLGCEILASEVPAICDAFFAQAPLLDQLFSYFEKDPPLNSLLSSYTSRVATILLQRKTTEMITYLKQKQDIVQTFLKHVGNASVMDFLLKVIQSDDVAEDTGVLQWLCDADLIPSLIHKFDQSNNSDVHENASQALADIIVVSSSSNNSPLIAQLESESIVKTLFEYILSNGVSSSMLHGLTVLTELLRRHSSNADDVESKLEDLPPFLRIVVSNLGRFLVHTGTQQQGEEKKQVPLLPQPIGPIEPLGFHRLKIVEFFAVVARTNKKCIDDELMKLGVIAACLDLFFAHQWNNFLHTIVEQMIVNILEGTNQELKLHLLKDAKLIEHICVASEGNEQESNKPRGVRRGYMGHITSISVNLISAAAGNEVIDTYLSEHEGWNAYVKGALASTRERENKIIGGYMPPGTSQILVEDVPHDIQLENFYEFHNDFGAEDFQDDGIEEDYER
eukprot:TRINITY_DN684_c0_g1_i1.p1 TRINITY_DN684_c0_g1~~TRINITY_DN684_c0_g1_i1.p1  ORF type:complete len:531 (-),score=148.79 TRINITY_DN684_c0_g1_i1:183-1775(-)